MIINHNMSAEFANRVLTFQDVAINKNIEKLSSGMRINRAGDDASGLAVSEKLRSQIRGLNQAVRNIENAVSFIQATEGYLGETHDILHRLRELAVQSANGIYSDEDRMRGGPCYEPRRPEMPEDDEGNPRSAQILESIRTRLPSDC